MGKERARRTHWLEPVKIYYMKAALQNAPIITRLLDVLKSKNEKAMEIIALYFKNNDLKKTLYRSHNSLISPLWWKLGSNMNHEHEKTKTQIRQKKK